MLMSWRYSWWAYWAVLARYILPERYHWLVVPNRMSKGNALNNDIIDSTATMAMKTCAAGLWTGLTSPSRPWFKVGVPEQFQKTLAADAAEWLSATTQALYSILGGSNFYTTMAQAFRDVTTFGTAPVIIYEDFEDVIRCYLPCAGEYYLAVGSRFSVDTLYREFVMTVAQIVEMFTLEKCPQQIRTLWETAGGSLENEFVVGHAIEPNFALAKRNGSSGEKIDVVPGVFTFREVYWLKGQKTDAELSRKGFHERPFMAARWSTVSNDPYGRSPGMDALGDTKQIQLETLRKAEFIDKGVRPPMGADPELKNEPSSIQPGNITYTNTAGGRKGFWPLFEPNPSWLTGLVADIAGVSERIKEAFYVPIFMAISQMEGVQPRNELELTKRDLERLQVLGPFIELFETEFADPAIMRVIQIALRRKLLAPMPDSLRGIPMQINYTSIMRIAQRNAQAVGMKDFAVTGSEASTAAQAAGVPNPLRIVNWDKWYRKYGDLSDIDPDILYTEEEVEAHDQEHARQLQQQQALSTTIAGVTAAQSLGNAKTTSDTALGQLIGGGGSGAAAGGGP